MGFDDPLFITFTRDKNGKHTDNVCERGTQDQSSSANKP